jgi:hypothetical protein
MTVKHLARSLMVVTDSFPEHTAIAEDMVGQPRKSNTKLSREGDSSELVGAI